ncbi:MAG: HU family DNA-binding protein [Gemmataceae bacterium]
MAKKSTTKKTTKKEVKKELPKPRTKTQMIAHIVEKFEKSDDIGEIDKKQAAHFFDVLEEMIMEDLSEEGAGTFTLPGLLKLKRDKKKPTKERQGTNLQTGEKMTIAPKPAKIVVRVRVLKKLKEEVEKELDEWAE